MIALDPAPCAARIDDQASLIGQVDKTGIGVEFLWQRHHGLAVADQFKGQQQPQPPHVPDEGEAVHQPGQPRLEQVAHGGGIGDKVVLRDLVQHGTARRAGQRVAGIGIAMQEATRIEHRLDHVGPRHHRPQGRVTGGEPLGEGDDVRRDAPMLGGDELAGAPGAGHHLVIDQQDAEFVADLADARVIAVGRHQRPGRGATHRLHDEGQHAVGPLGQDLVAQQFGIFQPALVVIEIVIVEIAGRRGDLGHLAHHRRKGFRQRIVTGQRQRPQRRAVVGGIARDHLPAAVLPLGQRVLPRHLDRAFHRLGPAGDKEHPVQPLGHQRGGLGGKTFRGFGLEMQPVAKGGAVHLRLHRVQNARVGMADIGHHRPGGAVDVRFAIRIVQIDPLAIIKGRTRLARLIEEMRHLSHSLFEAKCLRRKFLVRSFSGLRKITLGGPSSTTTP